MHDILDLTRHPIDDLDSVEGKAMVREAQQALVRDGMFNLAGLVRADALARAVQEVSPVLASKAFTHARKHNIYFRRDIDGLASDHPALRLFETVNHTICADQIADSVVVRIYDYPPLAAFLARVMDKPALHVMADPLARVNVMKYEAGEALNWHFDRSEFTTTLLLQAPATGGAFEYARDLRSDSDPNYDGVARLLDGNHPVEQVVLEPGTLNVFRGKNTAHRVTPVGGTRARIIAVFSYYDRPGVTFSAEERMGFYGRAG